MPYYQPVAALQLFNRTLNGWELTKGEDKVKQNSGSTGPKTATHTQASVPLPTATKASGFGELS